jgi:hypothetical protein
MKRVVPAVLLSVIATAAPAPAGHSSEGSGAIGLDVYAQDGVLDLLVASREGQATELRHQRSRDGGRTWSAPVPVPLGAGGLHTPNRGADPQVAARGDRVVVLWTRPGASRFGSGPLATAVSNDGGRTWSAGANPADDRSQDGHGYADLVVDAAGRFHAVWLDSRDGGQGLRAARSTDGGATWSANATLDSRTCECCWNALHTSGAQGVRVIYRDKDPRDLAVAASDDGGGTWTRLGPAGAFRWSFEGCPHVGGALARTAARLHALAWTGEDAHAGLHVLASLDDGRTWGPPRRLGSARAHRGDLAAAGRTLAAAWDEPAEGGRGIHAALSTDEGRTWTTPRRLSEAAWNASVPLVVATGSGFRVFWTEAQGQAPARWQSAEITAP